VSPRPDGRRHTLADLYHERTSFDFIGRSWRWALLSGTVILISLIAFATGGLNLGIDFEGGTSWQFTTAKGRTVKVADVRSVVSPLGISDAKVIVVGGNSARVQSKNVSKATQDKVTDALAKYGGIKASSVSVTDVGPTWGKQVSSKALRALFIFFIVIAVYLTLRFEWKMAASAILAVIHDILVTVGVYAITGFEVTPATVVAFLTILGYSLYDTVVVFDKVKENTSQLGTARGATYSDMVNRSMNQVLMRSLNTSFVALLPVASLLVVGSWLLGALSLRDFGLALFVGLLTGAYSSIFVATPILAWWKEREPRNRALRERASGQAARVATAAPAPATVGAAGRDSGTGSASPAAEATIAATPPRTPAATPGLAPRPRQQRRRKRR
jgi:preprotein translocase subunit SecF